MAVAYDNSSFTTFSATGTSHTFSHTNSGSTIVVFTYNNSDSFPISGVTYGGQALAQLSAVVTGLSVTWIKAWYLNNPPAGANDVVVSFTSDSSVRRMFGAVSFTGGLVEFDTSEASTYSETTSKSVTVTTEHDNCLIIDCCVGQRAGSAPVLVADASQTEVGAGVGFAPSDHYRMELSTKALASAGTVNMDWTATTQYMGLIAVSIMPAIINDTITVTENTSGRVFFPATLGVDPTLPHIGPKVWGT